MTHSKQNISEISNFTTKYDMFQSFNISPMSVALIDDSLRGMARSGGTKLPDVAVVLHTVELFSGSISNVREDPLNDQHSRGVGSVVCAHFVKVKRRPAVPVPQSEITVYCSSISLTL